MKHAREGAGEGKVSKEEGKGGEGEERAHVSQ